MTLIQRSQESSRHFPCSPQQELPDAQQPCTAIAIAAFSQGLLDVHYFENGWKQTVKSAQDLSAIMRRGFTVINVEGRFYLTRGLMGGSPLAELEKKLNEKPPGQKSVFISYQWDQSAIADDIQEAFEAKDFLVIRDKSNLSYGNDLREFMRLIKHPNLNYVIPIISDSYLKSLNCMYEVTQIVQRHNFADTLLPYMMANIYGGVQSYVQHWETKLTEAQTTRDTDKIKTIQDILRYLEDFTKPVAGRLNSSTDDLKTKRYQPFFDLTGLSSLPLDLKLQKRKEQALQNEEVLKDLASYIPVLGSRCLFDPKEQTFDLDIATNAFLAGDSKVFLLLGDSGGGKSTYLRYLENRLWKEWVPGKPIPLFISLPALKTPFGKAVKEALSERGFSEAERQELQTKHAFVFLLDGYDELKEKNNLYETNHLSQWKAKTLITCRTQYLNGEQSNYRNYFAPGASSLITRTSIDEASTSPFTSQQIEAYCRKFIEVHTIPRTWEQYKADIASVPDLAEMIENPFLLRIIAEVLPAIIETHQQSKSKEQLKLLRIEIFDAFVKNWFDREERRIMQIRTEVNIPDWKKAFAAFATKLALEMVQDKIVSVDYEENSDPFDSSPSKWEKFFSSDQKMTLIRSGVPLRKIGPHSYAFLHKSLLEYFSARAIISTQVVQQQPKSTGAAQATAFSTSSSTPVPASELVAAASTQESILSFENLNKKLLTEEPEIIRLLAECVIKDPLLTNQFFGFIERSKTDPAAALAAANAITVLNAAEVNLSKRDFKGVRIAGANLSHAILTSTNLSHADLRNVQLNEAILDYSTIAFSEIEGLELGQRPFINMRGRVNCIAVSPDGKWILSGSYGAISLWDCQTGRELRCFTEHSNQITSVAFSPDGKWALSGSDDKTVRLWDCQTGKELRCFTGHSSYANSVAFSPDGKWILSGSHDNTVRLWDCQTGQELRCFTGHSGNVTSVAFSPDGKWILSGSRDHTIRLWDCQTGQELHCFTGHSKVVNSVAFSPDGKWALSGSEDNTVRLWDCQTGQELRCFEGHNSKVESVAFSPDGKWALSGSNDQTVRLWDCQTGQELICFNGHNAGVNSVAFSPDSKWVLSADPSNIRTWNVNRTAIHKLKSKYTFQLSSIAISPDGKWALSGSYDKTVRLWDCQTGQELRCFNGGLSSKVTSVAFSPDGKWALSGSMDNTALLRDCQTGQELHCFKGHRNMVTSVAFSADGKWVLSGSGYDYIGVRDNTVRLWDCQTGKELICFKGHSNQVMSVAFSLDGKWALSGSVDNTARLWDCQTGQELRCFKGHGVCVTSVAFSPDGKWALSGSIDNTARLWDGQTGQEVRCFTGHSNSVNSVAFSLDGKWALSGSRDKTVRLWDCQTGKELYCLTLGYSIRNALFQPDGKGILVSTAQPAMQLWELFDERNNFQPSLKWSTGDATLSAQQLDMEGVKGLTKPNQRLLLQLGAIEQHKKEHKNCVIS